MPREGWGGGLKALADMSSKNISLLFGRLPLKWEYLNKGLDYLAYNNFMLLSGAEIIIVLINLV